VERHGQDGEEELEGYQWWGDTCLGGFSVALSNLSGEGIVAPEQQEMDMFPLSFLCLRILQIKVAEAELNITQTFL
jgi:hypothetical protein